MEESSDIQSQDKQDDSEHKHHLLFGGYQVKYILGEGGLGVVYLAKQLSMKRNVALKVLYPKWMKDAEFRKRFLLEARIVGKLSHPNLIQVFDIGYANDRYYFSMEYVKGNTIEDMIIQEGKLSVNRSLDYCLQVLDALQYIWKNNLIHRDIKPNNIMVNERNIAKLGDFGFVKSPGDESLDCGDFVLGTPDYISPEQAMGKENLDYRCDIYSLGASLYHMVTGNAPYSGSDSMVINKHIKAAIPSPRSIVPDLPESICWVIEKMMAKSPEDRYQTYEELRLDFLRVKAGENPKLQRIESSKSTIARIEDFGSMWLQICKLDEKVKTLQKKQYILITIIIILIVICIILLAILFHIK